MGIVRLQTYEPSRCDAPTVKAQELTHLIVGRPHLHEAQRFLTDFGLRLAHRTDEALYMKSCAPSPYCYRIELRAEASFLGFGLRVADESDLEALTRLPGSSQVRESGHPGGGSMVVLTAPGGFRVEAVCGQTPTEPTCHRPALPLNFGGKRARVNAAQRPPVEPPEVLRLGHLVLEVAEFQATCRWFTRHFGFLPSDVQVLPDGSPAVVFLRLDLGSTAADHHTLALAQGLMPSFSHAAFEVIDADALGIGQRVLRERGYKHAWGIGRHILGSQLFDYWHDPVGAKHEHYCDGDLFTAEAPMGVHAANREAMSQWGEPMPRSFTSPSLSPATLATMAHHIRQSPDLDLRKLVALARIFG